MHNGSVYVPFLGYIRVSSMRTYIHACMHAQWQYICAFLGYNDFPVCIHTYTHIYIHVCTMAVCVCLFWGIFDFRVCIHTHIHTYIRECTMAVCVCLFWGIFVVYGLRVCMSIAAAPGGGSNKPALNGTDVPIPIDPSSSMYDEFAWSDTEKGLVLSSFFWGYIITQVSHVMKSFLHAFMDIFMRLFVRGIYVYVCVCVCVSLYIYMYIYTYTHTHIYTNIYIHTHTHIHACAVHT
jgi:hypothetical protein